MKTLVYIIAPIVSLFSLSINAQVFQGQLDEIYLDTEQVIVDDFQRLNSEINNTEDFRFRKALKEARRGQDTLALNNLEGGLVLTKEEYLKTIRKIANRSNDSTEFISRLVVELPELIEVVKDDESYLELYNSVRPSTINGRLEVLPEVL